VTSHCSFSPRIVEAALNPAIPLPITTTRIAGMNIAPFFLA
jgi:hypothetical protein